MIANLRDKVFKLLHWSNKFYGFFTDEEIVKNLMELSDCLLNFEGWNFHHGSETTEFVDNIKI